VASLVSPYSLLLLQTVGIVAGAAALAMVVPGLRRRTAVPTAVAVLLTVIGVQQLWGASGTFDRVRTTLSPSGTGVGEREKCLADGGNGEIVPFVRWIAARVPEDEDFHYVSGSFDRPCFQLALLPRRIVPAGEARYVVYASPPNPADRRLLRSQWRLKPEERRLEFYARHFALERTG
jgi:hypothetical protein